MVKKVVSARLSPATIEWLDREISKGFIASYNHGIKLGLKLLRKNLHTTILFKKPNSRKTKKTQEDGHDTL